VDPIRSSAAGSLGPLAGPAAARALPPAAEPPGAAPSGASPAVVVAISPAGRAAAEARAVTFYGLDVNQDGVPDVDPLATAREIAPAPGASTPDGAAPADAAAPRGADGRPLSADEQRELRSLQARDAEVRAHEQAHAGAGGGHTGAISYTYQVGPDGRRYAIGGSVPIDIRPAGSPAATVAKAQQIRAAALAPGDPSPADIAAAAAASRMEADAQARLRAAADGAAGPSGAAPAPGTLPAAP